MPANYGRQTFAQIGYDVRVSADGHPNYKIGGITLAATTLPTNGTGSALTLAIDQTLVQVGGTYLILGTVMCRIGGDTDTVTITGSPTGGTFTISVTANGSTQTTTPLAYNATTAAVQTALAALTNVGGSNAGGTSPVTVTGTVGSSYALAFTPEVGEATVTAAGTFAGGTSPAATGTTTMDTVNAGRFGPYNSAATDGRQTLTPGDCFVLDATWLDTPTGAFPGLGTAHPPVIQGGRVDSSKLVLSTGQGQFPLPAGYPAGPSLTALMAACPGLILVND